MNYEQALVLIKDGFRVTRAGWKGKGMYIFLIDNWTYTNGQNDNYPCAPFIAMKTADNQVVPWLVSQTDLLAEDWQMVITTMDEAILAGRIEEHAEAIRQWINREIDRQIMEEIFGCYMVEVK